VWFSCSQRTSVPSVVWMNPNCSFRSYDFRGPILTKPRLDGSKNVEPLSGDGCRSTHKGSLVREEESVGIFLPAGQRKAGGRRSGSAAAALSAGASYILSGFHTRTTCRLKGRDEFLSRADFLRAWRPLKEQLIEEADAFLIGIRVLK